MQFQESAQMYLETIYLLTKESTHVRSVDVAEHMGYSRPSVSRAVGLLKQGGLLRVDEDGFLTLTDAGQAEAEKIFARHTLLTELLQHLGVGSETAAEDACKIEHVISDETMAAIRRYLKK